MKTVIDELKRRQIKHYRIQVTPDPVTMTVEMPSRREIKVGVSIALNSRAPALDSSEVEVAVIGTGHFNPVGLPHPGALPELRAGTGRAAVAAFRFEAAEGGSRPAGLELRLGRKMYRVDLRRGADQRGNKGNVPPSVAKVLPTGWPKWPSK